MPKHQPAGKHCHAWTFPASANAARFLKPNGELKAIRYGFRYWFQQNVWDEMLGTILLIILVLLLIGALPTWGYSGGWGYYPSGGVGLLLVIVVILLLVGRI
jgi:Protein of unknown function (DUF3309)